MNSRRFIILWTLVAACCGSPFTGALHAQEIWNAELINQFQYTFMSMAQDGDIIYFESYGWVLPTDLSDPYNEVVLDTLDWQPEFHAPPNTDFCRGIALTGERLYAFSDYKGLISIDVSDPSNIELKSFTEVDTLETRHLNLRYVDPFLIIESFNYAYVFDVSEPDAPRFLTRFLAPAVISSFMKHKAIMSGTAERLWLGSGGMFDLRLELGKLSPQGEWTKLKDFPLPGYELTAILEHNDRLYLGIDGVVDIYAIDSNDDLSLLSRVTGELGISEIKAVGDLLYVLYGVGDLAVYDLSDPYEPQRIAKYTEWAAYGMYDMAVMGEYVLLLPSDIGVQVVKIGSTTGAAAPAAAPQGLALHPAYPNPFSGCANIVYTLDTRQEIAVDVYNALGSKVRSLVHRMQGPGTHSTVLDGSGLPAGVYRVVLSSAAGTASRTVVLR